jgi:hypothetical protein
MPNTFHILIATAGRPSLRRMLDSLRGQLTAEDAITIVFDGAGARERAEFAPEWLDGHASAVSVIDQEPNLGFWGHGIRNEYQGRLSPATTYIMHADDDDVYTPGAFATLRQLCVDPTRLYFAKMNSNGHLIPSQNERIVQDGIGTPCGIVPISIAAEGHWVTAYGGDGAYYIGLASNHAFTILDAIIYLVRP